MVQTLIVCPHCNAKLKLQTAAAPEKKVRCSSCQTVFAPPDDALALPAPAPSTGILETASNLAVSDKTPDATFDDPYRTGQPPGLASKLADPEQLGAYRIVKLLGEGGMGRVYQAEDRRLKRHVALKVMLPAHAADAKARQRFLRESQAQASLEHDHIVAIYQADEVAGVPFIAMPLLVGATLADRLRHDGRPALEEALRIGRETAEGLAAAHERGLIHRDVKPSNLWLEGKRRRVKILDFGLARAVEGSDAAQLTGTGTTVGTPAFMAPEQARGETVDARCDLFSLGCVLYQLVTGVLPFQGLSVIAVLHALANETPPPPRQLNPEVPQPLSDLIVQLLAKAPKDRPASAQAVAESLAQVERTLHANAPTEALVIAEAPVQPAAPADDALPKTGPARKTDPAQPIAPAPLRRRAPASIVGMIVATLLLLTTCGGGMWLFQVVIIRDKDGNEVARIKLPKDGTVEIERQPSEPIVPLPKPKNDPASPRKPWQPIPVGQAPLDKLDPAQIPAAERFHWQPKELVAVLGTHQRRSWSYHLAAAFSADGTLAATGAGDVTIWDVQTQTAKMVIPARKNAWVGAEYFPDTTAVSFLPDGKQILCLRQANGLNLQRWDISGSEPKMLPVGKTNEPGPFWGSWRYVWFIEEGKTVVALTTDFTLNVINLRGPKPEVTVKEFAQPHNKKNQWPVVSDGGEVFYISGQSKLRRATIRDARLANDEELPIPLAADGGPRALTRDGKKLVVWADKELQFWDVATKQPKLAHRIPQQPGVGGDSSVVLSPDGRWLAVKYNSTALYRLDAPEPKFVAWLDQTNRAGPQGGLTFSPDGRTALVANSNGLVRFWDVRGPEPKELSPLDLTATFPVGQFMETAFDPLAGTLLLPRFDVPADKGQRRQLWSLAAPTPQPGLPHDFEGVGRFHHAGGKRWVRVKPWGDGNSCQLFHAVDGSFEPCGEPFGHKNVVGSVSPDGHTLVLLPVDARSQLEGWDLSGATARKQWALQRNDLVHIDHDNGEIQVWHSGDGRWFATRALPAKAGEPWQLVIWRNTAKEPVVHVVLPIPYHPVGYRAAFSPDGRYLAHTPNSHEEIVLLDLTDKTPREIGKFTDIAKVFLVYGGHLAFHPDSKKLAVGSAAGICILDVPTLRPLWDWPSPGLIAWLDWAADGRHLVTHNRNMTLYVLRLSQLAAATQRSD